MITWRKKLYVSEGAKKRKRRIVSNIRSHKLQLGAYVITLAANGKDCFDIIPSYMLSETGYHGEDVQILGIASGREEAAQLCGQMLTDVFEETGDYNVREYFG